MKTLPANIGQVRCLHTLRATVAVVGLVLAASQGLAASQSSVVSFGPIPTFGGRARYAFSDQAGTNTYRASFAASANCYVLNQRVPLASGNSTLNVWRGNHSRVRGNLRLGTTRIISYDRSWAGSAEFRTPSLIGSRVGGEVTFGIGPVSLKLRGKAVFDLYAKSSIQVTLPPAVEYPTVKAAVGPVLDAAVDGSARVSLGFASLRLAADMTLVHGSLQGQITYTQTPPSLGRPFVDYLATASLQEPDGNIRAYGSIDLPIVGTQSGSWTLFDIQGASHSWVLASGRRSL